MGTRALASTVPHAAVLLGLKLAGLIYPSQGSLVRSTYSRFYHYEADNDELADQL